MQDIFQKLKVNQTVFQRTKNAPELPKWALYSEWLSGQNKRRVLDPEGQAHDLDDKVLQSHYKLVTKSQAKKLLAQYWPQESAKTTQPAEASKPAAKAEASRPAAKKAKAAKKVSKKKNTSTKKAPAAKASKKKSAAKKKTSKKAK